MLQYQAAMLDDLSVQTVRVPDWSCAPAAVRSRDCSSAAFRDCTLSYRDVRVAKLKMSRLYPNWSTVTKPVWTTIGPQQLWGLGIINIVLMLPLEVRGDGGTGGGEGSRWTSGCTAAVLWCVAWSFWLGSLSTSLSFLLPFLSVLSLVIERDSSSVLF